ncbi:hypothetical protein ACO02O_09488 [Dirofilaria immitis]
MTKIVEIPTEMPVEEIMEEKPFVTAKIITGLFKKGETYLDYPVTEHYEGPIDSTYRIPDVESEPIEQLVSVYHSGRSDELVPVEEKKPSIDVGETFTDAAQALGAKITSLFKRGAAHLDYPTSGPYDGPLAITSLTWDVEGEPLQQHVNVYHSGRSDESMTKIVEIPTEMPVEEIMEEKPFVTAKIITGLFKKGETYLDYPVTEHYEGPIDSTYRIPDVESEPIEQLVSVYHSGRSDELVPVEEKKPSIDVGETFTDAAQALGAKITSLFKRGAAHLDYPTSGPYDGPLAITSLTWDVEGEPLQQHVNVYHSGRSDESMTKIVEIPTEMPVEEIMEEKPFVTAKIITGLFKKGETYLDYPVTEHYEGPIDSTYRIPDVESEPIEQLVSVYHSGRSDELVPVEEKKPSIDVGETFTDAAQALGAKITSLFKRGAAHLDYPTSGPYDGPLAITSLTWDVEGEPLQQHVNVYHSGRSDESMTKIVEIPTEMPVEEIMEEKPFVTAKIITGLFKKGETYLDYPVTEHYEGPIDSTYRIPDVESEPIEQLVSVYHSGRSDELVPVEEKKPSIDVGETFTDAAQALGAKITSLFKRGAAHLDYPTSGPYDGPLAITSLTWDVEGEPLQQHVNVYHSGRSDESMTKIVEIPTEMPVEEIMEEKPFVTAKIITGLFKKGETYLDYPVTEHYEGPIDSTYRIPDVESEPIEQLVSVYHSGRSDELVPVEEKKPSIDVGETFTDAAQALGAKITSLFKRGAAHLDYPTSGPYDGPLAITSLTWDVEGEPLQQHVNVYHSGRSDESMTKIVEIPTEMPVEEIMEEKPFVTAKIITGLFKKGETYLDYPVTEHYEGPIDSTYRIPDVESEPIEQLVSVYHSGRSDELVPVEEKKPSIDVGETFTDAAQALGAKITSLFKRGAAHLDYPTSGPYDGPLAITSLTWDVEGEPLQQHVNVYHSGRSDESMTKIVEIPTEMPVEEIMEEKPFVTAKIITGLFKKGETYLDYPVTEHYEGPIDSTYRIPDVESEPIEQLVSVYHSGRSDELVPVEEKKPSIDVGETFTDAAQALGAKITSLFKRGAAHLDYPTSGPYDGPLAITSLTWDVEGEPLQQHVNVYHSGRSDESMTKIVEIPTEMPVEEIMEEKPFVTAKIITGLFKKGETYLDYPVTEHYEGPIDSTYRIPDVESEPIEQLVSVYHSGRSDELVPVEEKKPSIDVGETFTDAAQALGAKITSLFKRGAAHLDYPTSGPYDGPLAITSLTWDVEGEPLQQHVNVYHSGRSDESMTKIVEIPTEMPVEEIMEEKPFVTAKIITGLFKKGETYLDYPVTEHYEGPIDSTYRIPDVESEPIEQLVSVYHSGRSDELVPVEEKKPSIDVGETFTDAAQALGAKITSLFKRGAAHLDYPTSGPYDGPLAITSLTWDVEGEPLQQHVNVYHSGRSDESMTKIVEIPTEMPVEEIMEEKPFVTAKIITGLFKKGETYLDYPVTEHYEGPIDSTYRIPDVESEPIEQLVSVYHSGRSDELVPVEEKKPSIDVGETFTDAAQALGAKITSLFKRGAAHLDYPTSGPYDGPLAITSLTWDVEGEPLQQHVNVYHSGRSDESMTKIVEIPTEMPVEEIMEEKPFVTAKIITGLFKKGETYLDYPVTEHYEGPIDSTYRIPDVESEPIEQLVSVYHSGRSDELVPVEEKKPSIDVGETFTDAAQALGAKITSLFKRGAAHLDYPTSGPYDGPLAITSLTWDVEGEPLQQHVNVYHSGRSDESMTKIVEIPTEMPVEEIMEEKPFVTAKIITGLFKKGETYLDYPVTEHYEGPIDSTYRIPDVESEPIEQLVSVYHSGRSDELVPVEEKKPSIDVGETFTDAAQALGAKITSLFKRGAAHLDYPTSGPYDGPLAITSLTWDVEGEPLQQHVNVYHSGRSDESMTKIVEIPTEMPVEEIMEEKPFVTAKIITGLFKKGETYLDYPVTEHYEGPIDSTYRIPDVESEPIEQLVSVYHSGRSDELVPVEEKKPSIDVGETFTDAAQALGAKITSLFKRGAAHLDYPTSGPYDGPLAITSLTWDVEGEPLQQHVNVYHSGRSDESMTKIVEIPTEMPVEEIMEEKPFVTAKIITGLFKKGETYLDYPVTEHYEGPIDSTYRIPDVESEPIEQLVSVYHSGRSDELVPVEEKKPSIDVGETFTDAAQALGAKITSLFKRGAAHLDYPTSGPYDGPLAITSLTWDVEGEPLQQHVNVYHSGRSDESMTKIVEIPTEMPVEEIMEEKPFVTAKIITGLFKKGETYLDYPVTEHYEGPIDSTYRIPDVESEPIEQLVSVYHSGRSDELVPVEEKKPSIDVGETFTDAAQALGAKITSLFKRGAAHLDYPTSGPYDGPLAITSLTWDVEGEPLQQHVNVYHSGRSDESMTKIVEIPTEMPVEEIMEEKPFVTAKIITGLFKKGETYLDYPVTEHYEGPIDSTYRIPDVESEPIEQLVSVYHSGRSDELVPVEEKKPSIDVGETFTDAAQALGAKITSLFKRGAAHLDYPTSGPYDGPLAITSLTWDVEGEPLQQHVNVYHSGRSDESMTKIVEIPTEMPVEEIMEEKPFVTAKIITGLFKKGETYLDYPVTEHYEGPIDSTYRIPDVESEPIEQLVSVYHSGRSDELVPVEEKKPSIDVGETFTDAAQALGAKITSLFKRGAAHLDYPTSGPYDGPLAITSLTWDVEGEPLQQHVNVYHSGRSDESMTKIVEIPTEMPVEEIMEEKPFVTAKIITGLFKKGETYLDYPVTEHYEGPIDSTYRIPDVESEPIEQLVSVYHSGRSDELVPVEEKKPSIDVGETFTDAAQALGAKITSLFKRGAAHLDYPTSGPYDGPLAITSLTWDVEGEPLQQHVNVYHSGRSDESMTKIVEIPTEMPVEEIMEEKPFVTAKIITGLFKKGETYLDYPVTEHYEGPIDSTYRIPDVESEPIEQLVSVYHSGRSDELVPVENDKRIDIQNIDDLFRPVGTELSVLLEKKTVALEYPVSEKCVEPLSLLLFSRDVEGLPLQEFVSIYHCGESDLQSPFHFPVWQEEISIANFESQLYPLSKDTGSHDRISLSNEVKPLISPSIPTYPIGEYRIYRRPERLIVPSESGHKTTNFDISINSRIASGRSLPIGIAHPVPKAPKISESRHLDEISTIRGSKMVSTPYDFDYHRKTREVDYWIGRRSERQSKPCRDLTTDIGIDLASDACWEQRNAIETHPLESISKRENIRDFPIYSDKTGARIISSTTNLHWTTVSETTSVSYKKRISIERRRPHRTSSHLATHRRQYRPPPPPAEVSDYARHDRAIFESSTMPRTYAGIAIEGDLRTQRARYEASSLPSTYYSSTETRVQRNPVHYDLPRPSSPPRYEHWIGERNDWTVEGLPRQPCIIDQNDQSLFANRYIRGTRQEALHYQKPNLEELPIISLINDLPMIEDGADECSCATIPPAAKIKTQDLTPGEHSRPYRSAPLRRARQRIRNLCTML